MSQHDDPLMQQYPGHVPTKTYIQTAFPVLHLVQTMGIRSRVFRPV